MDLDVRPEGTVSRGSDNFELSSGQNLKIETSPGGEEILNYTSTNGAFVSVSVSIVEYNE